MGKTLITGCPRSGTLYTTNFLQECGKDFTHELDHGTDGVVSWYLAPTIFGEGKIKQMRNYKEIRVGDKMHALWRPAHRNFPLPTEEYKKQFTTVLHQVREPRLCISSMSSLLANSLKYSMSFFPNPQRTSPVEDSTKEEKQDHRLKANMHFWYYWNKIAMENSEWTYRIESLNETRTKRKFCKALDLKADDFDRAYEKTSRHTNTRPKKRARLISWKKIRSLDEEMFNKILALSEELGYNVDTNQ